MMILGIEFAVEVVNSTPRYIEKWFRKNARSRIRFIVCVVVMFVDVVRFAYLSLAMLELRDIDFGDISKSESER